MKRSKLPKTTSTDKLDIAFIIVWLVTLLLCITFWGAVIFGIVKLVLHYT